MATTKSVILLPSQYDVLIDVWNKDEPYFRFRDSPQSIGFMGRPWRVGPEHKKKPVHALAGAGQALVDVFPSAIAIGSPIGRVRTVDLWWAVLMTPVTVFCALFGIGLLLHGQDSPMPWILLFFAAWFLVMQLNYFKNWLCAPRDWPIIFNRKDRTVSYAMPHAADGKGGFGRDDRQYHVASWDDAQVRSYAFDEVIDWRKSSRCYRLALLWGKHSEPHILSSSVGYRLGPYPK